MKKIIQQWVAMFAIVLVAKSSLAFCGFYVAKADASLFNNKSEVIMVRDGKRNVITMSSDFKGNMRDFAMVVPVPTVLAEKDIRVVKRNIFQTLNDYSAPRLVEYYDYNPCQRFELDAVMLGVETTSMRSASMEEKSVMVTKDDYKVTIEAQYQIGEYDILILSAKESVGLKLWLTDNGYKIPQKAEEVLEPYIKSNMKFFVVKVNLEKMPKAEEYLSPIQIEFEHDKFMLPLRLGMANSQGSQDMIVYAFTRQGRVECTNYRTVKMPTDRNIPLFLKPEFGNFYKSLFEKQYLNEGRNAVFLEYAWNVSPYVTVKCDPCVGAPPVNQDFVNAGIWWLNDANVQQSVFFTRLHVRYTRDKFPADLQFQVTPNNEHYQCRYVLTNPANGEFDCDEGQVYLNTLYERRKKEIDEMYALASWNWEQRSKQYLNEFVTQMKEKPVVEEKKGDVFPFAFSTGSSNGPSVLLILSVLLVFVIGLLMSLRWLTRFTSR
ncbi:MAG: DUF2330 domain-containing protein [Flavobacteriales bacterium]